MKHASFMGRGKSCYMEGLVVLQNLSFFLCYFVITHFFNFYRLPHTYRPKFHSATHDTASHNVSWNVLSCRYET